MISMYLFILLSEDYVYFLVILFLITILLIQIQTWIDGNSILPVSFVYIYICLFMH